MHSVLAFDLTNFVGRFHPLFVHLPIGFLLLAILMEWYRRFRKADVANNLIAYAWFIGGLAAILTVVCGWYLGETGRYFEEDLFWHRWIGVLIIPLSFLGWWIKKKPEQYSKIIQHGINIVLILVISFEGHLGGNLTHGKEYLFEYAPESISKLVVQEKEEVDLSKKDTIFIYQDFIKPIFEEKCVACHNDKVKRGGYNMASREGLLEGGNTGPAFLPGHAHESALFKRLTLPQKSMKFMPPIGSPLTYDEVKLVEWWIEQHDPFEQNIEKVDIDDDIKTVLLRRYNLDTEPKLWYETAKPKPLDTMVIGTLRKKGFLVKVLAQGNNLLDVKYIGNNFTADDLQSLNDVAQHITWLALPNTGLQDEQLAIIGEFSNLTRLELQKNPISDGAIEHLLGLQHLESLNLYGTKVTDDCIEKIKLLKSLRRIYLWKTNISPKKAMVLKETNTDLEVSIGNGLQ